MDLSFLCALPLLSGLMGSCGAPPPLATGYVEGEYVLLAPLDQARIEQIGVRRGDRVMHDQQLAKLDSADALIAVRQAEASLDQARAQLANLKEGRRPEEIAVIEASLSSAKAQAEEARRSYARQQVLTERGIAAQSQFDAAETAVTLADAQVGVYTANLAVARLPARPMEITAAESLVKQAEATLDNARLKLERRNLVSPANGVVQDLIRKVGEVSGPSQPVLSILPDNAVVLRLYVPEPALHDLKIGTRLTVRCDGCGPQETALVSYIADTPEFTPPVIYSIESRQKLVYLIEARPELQTGPLMPGQIVDVVLAGGKP